MSCWCPASWTACPRCVAPAAANVFSFAAPVVWHQSAASGGLFYPCDLRCASVPSGSHAAVQVVCPGSLLLALNFLKQVNNAYFRIGFNSLGAYGTINHLHFQVRFWASHAVLAVDLQALAQVAALESACQLVSNHAAVLRQHTWLDPNAHHWQD